MLLRVGLGGHMGVGKDYIAQRLFPQVLEDEHLQVRLYLRGFPLAVLLPSILVTALLATGTVLTSIQLLGSSLAVGIVVFLLNYLWTLSDYQHMVAIRWFAFADQIKAEVYARDPALTYHQLYHEKGKAVRQKLQQRGTEEGRHAVGPDIWIRATDLAIEREYEQVRAAGYQHMIALIKDVRFPNELEYITKHHGTHCYIQAPRRFEAKLAETAVDAETRDVIRSHASETSVSANDFDHVIQNDVGMERQAWLDVRWIVARSMILWHVFD
jgi:competence protein ComGF